MQIWSEDTKEEGLTKMGDVVKEDELEGIQRSWINILIF